LIVAKRHLNIKHWRQQSFKHQEQERFRILCGDRLTVAWGQRVVGEREIPEAIAHSSSSTSASRTDLGWLRVATQTKTLKGNRSVDPHLLLHNMKINTLHPARVTAQEAVQLPRKGSWPPRVTTSLQSCDYDQIQNKSLHTRLRHFRSTAHKVKTKIKHVKTL
jgi:hypothetical protein